MKPDLLVRLMKNCSMRVVSILKSNTEIITQSWSLKCEGKTDSKHWKSC